MASPEALLRHGIRSQAAMSSLGSTSQHCWTGTSMHLLVLCWNYLAKRVQVHGMDSEGIGSTYASYWGMTNFWLLSSLSVVDRFSSASRSSMYTVLGGRGILQLLFWWTWLASSQAFCRPLMSLSFRQHWLPWAFHLLQLSEQGWRLCESHFF